MKRIKEDPKTTVFYIYAFWMLVIVPLTLNNAYFDLVQAKARTLHIGLAVAIVLMSAVYLLSGKKQERSFDFTDKILLSLTLISLVSSCYSGRFLDSFFGNNGWGIGSFVISGSIGLVLLFSGAGPSGDLWIPVALVNIGIYVLSFFHSAEIDLFNLHEGIRSSQYFDYFSLTGNANWMAGYLSLLLPVFYFRFVEETRKPIKYVYGLCLILGTGNILLCNSDSYYLGLTVSMMFLVPYLLKDIKRYRSIFLLPAVFGLFGIVIKTIPVFAGKVHSFSGLTGRLCNYGMLGTLVVSGVTLFCLCKKIELSKPAQKTISLAVSLICIAGLLWLVFDMMAHLRAYDYSWGNNRLRIWNESIFAFKYYFRPIQKLIGIGPENQAPWYGNLNNELGAVIIATHSEPLQALFTMGIVGFLLYVSSIVLLVWSHMKNRKDNTYVSYLIGLLGYLGQSLVNSMNPLNAGIVFVLIALLLQEDERRVE